VARPGRVELPTLCLEDNLRMAILLLVLGSANFLSHGFARCLGLVGPKLDPIVGMNP
jgi:hypothetical protein